MKTKTDLLIRNSPGESTKAIQREEEGLQWERFVKQVGFKLEVKE